MRQVQQVQGLDDLEDANLRRLKQYISGKGGTGVGDAEPAFDLSLLISALLPEHLVREPDEVWEEELLLTAVASELQSQGEHHGRIGMGVQGM